MFLIGTFIADAECYPKGQRPLDIFRDLNWPLSILRNVVLLAIFLIWGSYPGESTLKRITADGHEGFFAAVTFNFNLPKEVALYLAGVAGFLLALTSEVT